MPGTVILLGTIWTFNQFPVIALLTGGGQGGATNILVTEAYERAFQGIRDYAGAATYGAIIASVLVVFVSLYRRWLERQTSERLASTARGTRSRLSSTALPVGMATFVSDFTAEWGMFTAVDAHDSSGRPGVLPGPAPSHRRSDHRRSQELKGDS